MSNTNEFFNSAAVTRVLPELAGVAAGIAMFSKDWASDTLDLKTALVLVIGLFSAGSRFYDGPSRNRVIDTGWSVLTGISVSVGLNILDTIASGEQIRAIPGWVAVGAVGMLMAEVGMTVKRYLDEHRRAIYWENSNVSIDEQLASEALQIENDIREKMQAVADSKRKREEREGTRIVVSTAKPYVGVGSKLPAWVIDIMKKIDVHGGKEAVLTGYHNLVMTDNGPTSLLEARIANKEKGYNTAIYKSRDALMMRVRDPKTGRRLDALLPPNLSRDVQHKLVLNISLMFRNDPSTAMDKVVGLINELYSKSKSDFNPEVFDTND